MQAAIFVDVFFDKLKNRIVIGIHVLNLTAGTNESDHHPLAANRADARCAERFKVITCLFVDILCRTDFHKLFESFFCRFKKKDIFNKCFLFRCQLIISFTRCFDCLFTVLCHGTDSIDQLFDLFCRLYILFICERFHRIRQLTVILHKLLLLRSKSIISRLSCRHITFKGFASRIQLVDQLLNKFRSLCIAVLCIVGFLCIVIRVMENDHVPILYGLFGNAQTRMYAVQRIHPTGKAAVSKLTDSVDRFHIIACGITVAHTGFCKRFFQHILNGCAGFYLIGFLGNPYT